MSMWRVNKYFFLYFVYFFYTKSYAATCKIYVSCLFTLSLIYNTLTMDVLLT